MPTVAPSGRAAQRSAVYREPSTPPPPSERREPDAIADELRARAMRVTWWLDAASVVAGLAVGLGALYVFIVEGQGSWGAARIAYLIAGLFVVAAGRALGRHLVRRAVARWVARAAREERVDGADVWRRIWTAYY
jgi:hypothetical protein